MGALFTGPMAIVLALGGGITGLATGVMSLMNEDGDLELLVKEHTCGRG